MKDLAFYLLKVALCSGLFFLYYHLALRNKLFHQWNRFYLLLAVVLSLAAPIVQVTIYHQDSAQTAAPIQLLQVMQSANDYLEEVTITRNNSVSADQWVLIAYLVVSTVLVIAFLKSLLQIFSIIRSHAVKLVHNIRFVNTRVPGTPFSFFQYIFWNDDIDIGSSTGQQIFQHELVHVKERHTLDKMFMQTVLIFFWLNPFFWLIKKELRMIHEFIADKKSVAEHGTAAFAAMILQSAYPKQFSTLANPFFQTSIKRRIRMLNKIQHPGINYFSRIIALPIIAITVLAFTLRTKKLGTPLFNLDRQVTVVIDAGHGVMPNGGYNGARAGDVYEDDIVLALAKKIRDINSNDKLHIVLTRSSAEIVDLHKRMAIANEAGADLFISLHLNATAPQMSKDGSSATSSQSGFDIYLPGENSAFQKQTAALGSALVQELSGAYPIVHSPISRASGIYVLSNSPCPAALIECGYITDEQDRAFITRESNQELVAQKILSAISRYFSPDNSVGMHVADTIPSTVKVRTTNDLNPGATITDPNGAKREMTNEDGIRKHVKNSNGGEKPLYVVNGKVYHDDLNAISPNDIQTINVLKGTAAVSKYGDAAKDGAIEITTREKGRLVASTNELTGKEKFSSDTIPGPVFSQVVTEPSIDKMVWRKFLETNLSPVFPELVNKGAVGNFTVNVRFIVELDGSLSHIETLNDPGYGIAAKLLPIMQRSPKWSPAVQNGHAVRSWHTQPVTFVIAGEGQNANVKPGETFSQSGKSFKKEELRQLTSLKNPENGTITSFVTITAGPNGELRKHVNTGNTFDATTMAMLNEVRPGDIATFEEIRANISGAEKKLPSLLLSVAQ